MSQETSASQRTRNAAADAVSVRGRPWAAGFVFFGGFAALALCMAASVSLGAREITLPLVWDAIFRFDPGVTEHLIVRQLRLPRAVGGALAGACFAAAGAVMQGVTRNPLADSSLLGLNAGAGLALALCLAFAPQMPSGAAMLYCFLGAGCGAAVVYGAGAIGRGGLSPVRLTLAGAAVSALLAALTDGLALHYRIGQEVAFWTAGSVASVTGDQVRMMLPWALPALLAALALSRSVTMLSLGDEVARGLGQRTQLVMLLCAIVVLVLAGASVSVVGAVGFVGLIVPHAARKLVGVDYRWIIPCSAVLGAVLVVAADMGARMINPPSETPVGALIALIGVPFFLYVARKERRAL